VAEDDTENTARADALDADEDAELIREFVQEAEQYFAAAEAALLTLERAPADADAIGVVFRAFHTVKGVSSLLGMSVVSSLAHQAESFLIPVRNGAVRFEGRYPELALRALDMLRLLVSRVDSGAKAEEPPATYDELSRQLASAGAASERPERKSVSRPASAASVSDSRSAGESMPAVGKARASKPPAAAASPAHAARQPSPEDAWIRVRAERLDALLDMVGELAISQSMVTEDPSLAETRLRDLSAKVNQCAKIVRGLHGLSLSLRMVPLQATFQKMGRVVRDTARRCGKQVHLHLVGADTEVDRNMADALADPLVHMVRNAVDHGIEPSAERSKAGKSDIGSLELRAHHQSGEVVIELCDDGRGLVREKILAKARRQGLVGPDARLADHEILGLIFAAGFSTSETVTDVSGRGVGMDVVRHTIEALSGRVEITSVEGKGTTFAIHLPLTLAITDGMLVKVGAERYVIPSANIQMSFRPEPQDVKTLSGRGEMVILRGAAIPMLRVHEAFRIGGAVEDPTRAMLVVVCTGEAARALLVDDLLGKYQVVTKTLGVAVGKVTGISGGAILGDGHVGLIIDPLGLIRLCEKREAKSSFPASAETYRSLRRAPFSATKLGGKRLTFFLDHEEYGIPISEVQEIVRMLDVTPVPHGPPHLRGVANLRGRILPVIDLRVKLGMIARPPSDDSRIIIVSSELGLIGLIVDRVSEVEEIGADTIDPAPDLGARASTAYVRGVGISGSRAQFLLDVAGIVGTQGPLPSPLEAPV